MCIILDANSAHLVAEPPPESAIAAVLKWLLDPKSPGRLVLGGRLTGELRRVDAARRLAVQLQRAGRVCRVPEDAVRRAEAEDVAGLRLESDDPHVIALALTSGARRLFSRDDALIQDFASKRVLPRPRGKVIDPRTPYDRRKVDGLLRTAPPCRPNADKGR